jgi:cytochrome c-type biogenesis protein CcmH/NrfG
MSGRTGFQSRRDRDNRAMLALRLAVLGLAVAACAWFALGVVQSHDQTQAENLLDQFTRQTPAATARIMSLLDTAGTLNPDRNIDLDRSQAQTRAGHVAAGVAIARAVVRAEPQNVNGWIVLGFAARRLDPSLARLAQARQLALAPPVRRAP